MPRRSQSRASVHSEHAPDAQPAPPPAFRALIPPAPARMPAEPGSAAPPPPLMRAADADCPAAAAVLAFARPVPIAGIAIWLGVIMPASNVVFAFVCMLVVAAIAPASVGAAFFWHKP